MNPEAKKQILRRIPYGLYVIGVKNDKEVHAFTGSWLSQCSLNPPCVALGVRHGTRSIELVEQGRVFSINFISKKDRKILEQFFKATPPDGNRFGELAFDCLRTGAPVLKDAIAYLECEVKTIVPAGDHSVVIGEVIEAEIRRVEAPLVMSDTPWHYGG